MEQPKCYKNTAQQNNSRILFFYEYEKQSPIVNGAKS